MLPSNTYGGAVRPLAHARGSEIPSSRLPASYWLLLVFLLLLYANTPFVLPAAEVVRPAKVVAALAPLAFICETVFGKRELRFAWPEGGLLIGFLAAAALSCLTALWPGYAADGVADLAK